MGNEVVLPDFNSNNIIDSESSLYINKENPDIDSTYDNIFIIRNNVLYKGGFKEVNNEDYDLFKDGKYFVKHKYGVFKTPIGIYYKGEINEGKLDGEGFLKLPNSVSYNGSFSNNLFEGYGEICYNNGSNYKGYFSNGEKNGNGILIIKDYCTIKGSFKDNFPNGNCEIFFSNNDYYKGTMKSGMIHGSGKYKSFTGDIYEGEFNNSMIEGFGKLTIINNNNNNIKQETNKKYICNIDIDTGEKIRIIDKNVMELKQKIKYLNNLETLKKY